MTRIENNSFTTSQSDDPLAGFTGHSDIDLLAQSTSPDLARLLLAYYPGAELKVPKSVDANHHLSHNLGFENARKLAGYAGGGLLNIPTRKFYSGDREAVIMEMIESGHSRQEIAIELGIGVRMLRNITKKMGISGRATRVGRPTALLMTPSSSSNAPLTQVAAFSNVIPLHNAETASTGKYNNPPKISKGN
jgi:hypothetical protein